MVAKATRRLRQEALDGPGADRQGQDGGPVPKDPRNLVQGEGGGDQHPLGVVIDHAFGGAGEAFVNPKEVQGSIKTSIGSHKCFHNLNSTVFQDMDRSASVRAAVALQDQMVRSRDGAIQKMLLDL